MTPIGLSPRYVNMTVTILDIIHHPKFNLKHKISETRFYLRLQAEFTNLGPKDIASLRLRTPVATPVRFIKPTQMFTVFCAMFRRDTC
jgi:hypothetical protein